ncbi:MAG: hypothetical protein NZV14_03205 [Bryobacteraceae bacterium]|nr:hypothetical protein [Bryobacteraceae bacterium]MDW8377143.1 hypothetical protein [Bryobacterales bacterium]
MRWLICFVASLTPSLAGASEPSEPKLESTATKPLAPLVRGVFQQWTGSKVNGLFQFQTSDTQLHVCAFSQRTYFESDHRRASIASIQTGNLVEVLSERVAEPPNCRALIVRVVVESSALRVRRPFSPPSEPILPRGNLLLSGIVVRTDENALLLRTRRGQSHWIQLRRDTRFGAEGAAVTREDLPLNRPVQIRAGRGLENDLEAYSIVWGEILKPR